MSGRLISPKILGLDAGNFRTDFGQSWTDLRTGNGPREPLLCVVSCDYGQSKMDCRIVISPCELIVCYC